MVLVGEVQMHSRIAVDAWVRLAITTMTTSGRGDFLGESFLVTGAE